MECERGKNWQLWERRRFICHCQISLFLLRNCKDAIWPASKPRPPPPCPISTPSLLQIHPLPSLPNHPSPSSPPTSANTCPLSSSPRTRMQLTPQRSPSLPLPPLPCVQTRAIMFACVDVLTEPRLMHGPVTVATYSQRAGLQSPNDTFEWWMRNSFSCNLYWLYFLYWLVRKKGLI